MFRSSCRGNVSAPSSWKAVPITLLVLTAAYFASELVLGYPVLWLAWLIIAVAVTAGSLGVAALIYHRLTGKNFL